MGAPELKPETIAGKDPVSIALDDFFQQFSPEYKEPYLELKIHLIRPDSIPAVNFYVKRGKRYRMFRERSNPFTGFEIQSLLDAGLETVFIDRVEAALVRKYLETFLVSPNSDIQVGSEAQVSLMRSAAVRITEDMFADPSPENIRKGMKAVTGFVNVLLRDPKSFYYLIRLSSHDPYTYQHSVGVGLNSIALGKRLKLSSEHDLVDLGVSGLLHDIGKTKVKPTIINKPGPLDKEEWAEMQQHASWGWDILKDNKDVTQRAKLGVLHHHEEGSGKGYPHGLVDNQISTFAKIITIADIFNALTTDRTYSKAKSPFEAFKLMQSVMMHKIDKQLFAEMVLIYGGKLE